MPISSLWYLSFLVELLELVCRDELTMEYPLREAHKRVLELRHVVLPFKDAAEGSSNLKTTGEVLVPPLAAGSDLCLLLLGDQSAGAKSLFDKWNFGPGLALNIFRTFRQIHYLI